jgi:ATP-dependent metalloprotease
MVRYYGYSDLVGPVNVSDNETISPSTRSLVDQEVRRMLEEAKSRATEVLTSKKTELDRLAKALIEYETLNRDEVMKVIKGEKIEKSIA